MGIQNEENGLHRYLSPLQAWALSIGCAVGWGSFVMPGTTFLPLAGPLGTVLGLLIGAAAMLLIGINYQVLMNKYPESGGVMTYASKIFGYDHGLFSAWFLILVYVAIMWANATAIVLIERNLFGKVLQWGFHYQVAGYDVFLGEILLTLATIFLFGLICMYSKKMAARVQTVMAVILVGGVLICAILILGKAGNLENLSPKFIPTGKSRIEQIFQIVVLAPWAFVGFESISNSTREFKFSPKKSLRIMVVSLIAGAACYILLALIAAVAKPDGYVSWMTYLNDLDNVEGLAAIPTFYAVGRDMGQAGIALLVMTLLGGIVTGLIGNYIAASRVIYSMAEEEMLPKWLGVLDKKGNPANAILFLMGISVFVPFLGRSAISWIVDITTIGALIAYAYTSAAAFKLARENGNTLVRFTGLFGLVTSALFFFYFMVPNIWSASNLAAESYLLLILWSVLGFFLFRSVYEKDTQNRFGKSSVAWLSLLFLILFTSVLWLRESTRISTERVLNELNAYNVAELAEHGIVPDKAESLDSQYFLWKEMNDVSRDVMKNSGMQMIVIMISLVIMFNIYKVMMQQQKKSEIEKMQAEKSNRAKSTFLSNMSHDLRTPMNAIIGYTILAQKEDDIPPKIDEYLTKITSSSKHLLALINDVLEMSRIESGRIELENNRTNLIRVLDDVRDLFAAQMQEKDITYTVETDGITNQFVMCDAPRLNRILLNLISNAYKFTPEGGSVTVRLRQTGATAETGTYELSVKDTGMGMTQEFAKTVFEEYSRDRMVSTIQGTGLGMAITKSIVDLMGGEISVETQLRKGTEFTIRLPLDFAEEASEEELTKEEVTKVDFTGAKALLVDDNMINREIASLILKDSGFTLDTAEDGKMAYDMVAAAKPDEYQVILMDIQMPVMNGYEATIAIRGLSDPKLSEIPIIAMTANAFAEDIQAAKDVGMNGHIAKPIDVTQMLEEIIKNCPNIRK